MVVTPIKQTSHESVGFPLSGGDGDDDDDDGGGGGDDDDDDDDDAGTGPGPERDIQLYTTLIYINFQMIRN